MPRPPKLWLHGCIENIEESGADVDVDPVDECQNFWYNKMTPREQHRRIQMEKAQERKMKAKPFRYGNPEILEESAYRTGYDNCADYDDYNDDYNNRHNNHYYHHGRIIRSTPSSSSSSSSPSSPSSPSYRSRTKEEYESKMAEELYRTTHSKKEAQRIFGKTKRRR